MSAYQYSDPETYDSRKLKPLEAYLETLWKPAIAALAKEYIHSNDIVADLGCGTLAHIHLMNHAQKIYVVDANKKMLEFGLRKLSEHNRRRVIPLLEQAAHTSIPESSCSIIWSIGLTEYVNIDELFSEMTRIAAPDATILLQFPNKYHLVHIAIQIAHTIQGTRSKRYRTYSEVRSVAKKYGWGIKKSIATGFYTPLPSSLIPLAAPVWELFNCFGNNTFLVLRKSIRR